MARNRFVPKVTTRVTRVWHAHPIAVASALAIARTWGHGIDGQSGTVLPTPPEYGGYVAPPQLFTGWNPAAQTHVGTPIKTQNELPGTSLPGAGSPLDSAMAQINAGSD